MNNVKNLSSLPFIIGFGLLMETIDISIINTAIPQMSISLQSNPMTLKLGITSYLLTLAAFIPISGHIADKYGTRNTFLSAMVVFLFGSFICGFAHSVYELVCGRLIQGVGGAMMTPVGRLILIKTFSKKDLVKAFSSLTMLGQLGVAIGPVIGGTLSSYMSWRYIFFVNIPLGVVALILIKMYIPNVKSETEAKFDFIGFVIFAIGAGLLTFALSLISETNSNTSMVYAMLISGVVILAGFSYHALHSKNPSLQIRLFKVRTFRIAVFGSLVIRLGIGGVPYFVPLLLQVGHGYSAFQSGLIILPYGIAMVMAKPYVKKMLHRFGFKTMLFVNPVILAVLLFVLAISCNFFNLSIIICCVFLIGFFSSMQFTYMNLLNFVDIEKSQDSKATSLSSVVQQLSMSFGVCAVALLLYLLNSKTSSFTLSTLSFTIASIVLGALCLCSTLIFTKLTKTDGANLFQ